MQFTIVYSMRYPYVQLVSMGRRRLASSLAAFYTPCRPTTLFKKKTYYQRERGSKGNIEETRKKNLPRGKSPSAMGAGGIMTSDYIDIL